MNDYCRCSMQDLFDASVHMGHRRTYWNPAMAPYIYGHRNLMHIIDLRKTLPMLNRALDVVSDIVAKGGKVLFVSTKSQSIELIKEEATRCGQYFVSKRWLGGFLTNWSTISSSIKNLERKQRMLDDPITDMLKKERLQMQRRCLKLSEYFCGVMDMGTLPEALFVIDVNRERIAIREAKKMGIPVIGVVDSDGDPRALDYPIPGNDDSARSIQLYCRLVSDAVIRGIEVQFGKSTLVTQDRKDEIKGNSLSKGNTQNASTEPDSSSGKNE